MTKRRNLTSEMDQVHRVLKLLNDHISGMDARIKQNKSALKWGVFAVICTFLLAAGSWIHLLKDLQ